MTSEINMAVVIAVLLALLVRIFFMEGYITLPTYDKVTGKFHLNILGTIFVGLVSIWVLFQGQPELFATPYVAFMTAYTTPHLFDKVVTSIAPSPPEKPVVVEEEASPEDMA